MKTLPLVEEMKGIVEEVISSCGDSIQDTVDVFSTTHQILQNFIFEIKQENGKVSTQLRESLARNKSLRRKDFDEMMQNMISIQEEEEKRVKNAVGSYLNEQEEMAQELRKGLKDFQDFLAKGEVQRVKEFHVLGKGILARQEERKQEVISRLKEFQKEQQEMTMRIRELLDKGKELRIRDLKSMLKEFDARHKERIACHEERKEGVRKMLGDFKEERIRAAMNWQAMQEKIAPKRRTGSS